MPMDTALFNKLQVRSLADALTPCTPINFEQSIDFSNNKSVTTCLVPGEFEWKEYIYCREPYVA